MASAQDDLAAGRTEAFRTVLPRLRVLAGSSAPRWRDLGGLYRRAGDPENACQALARAAGLAPGDSVLRVALAGLLRETGRLAEAVDQVEAACRLDPAAPDPCHLMGVLHLDQGLSGAAVEWLSRARQAGGGYSGASLRPWTGAAGRGPPR